MKKIIFTCIASLLAAPAFASEYNYLLNDIESLTEKISNIESLEEQIELDKKYEENIDLFPRGKQFEETSTATIRTDTVSSTNVYIKNDNGAPVILQDVLLSHWSAPYIRDMAERKIITGYKNANGTLTGQFGIGDKVTRAQLAKIATLAADIDTESCPETAANPTATSSWAERFIACAEYNRWSIFVDTTIDINTPATRSEVVTTILEAFKRSYEESTGTIFSDITTSFVFAAPIETAYLDGIVSGYKDANGNDTHLFGPFNSIDRAATAKIVSLAMQIYSR